MNLFLIFSLCFSLTASADSLMRIAHRGAPAFAPENTIPSFKKAIELNANYLELDVHQTRDQVLIVMHDTDVSRTTNGKGKIKDLTFSDLSKLDAGSWFGAEYKDQKIPTLDSVLDLLISHPDLKAIIELKEGDSVYPGMEKRVVDLVQSKGIDKRVIFKAFSPEVLVRLKKLSPSTPSLYVFVWSLPFVSITINTSFSFHSPFEVDVQILQSHYYFLTRSFVEEAHAKGYKVVVWGVETEKQMLKSIEFGVDGIETDHLDLLDKTSLLN